MSAIVSQKRNTKKPVRRKKSAKMQNLSTDKQQIIIDLASKITNLLDRTNKLLQKKVKNNKEYEEYENQYFAAGHSDHYSYTELLTRLVTKPFNIKIKSLEKIFNKMQDIFRYQQRECKDLAYIFTLSPVHMLTNPFTFIKPTETYISFNKACFIAETENLCESINKRDVFCAYLYQITTFLKTNDYTPYIVKSDLKQFYKYGIENKKGVLQYSLPKWCKYEKDSKLFKDILEKECAAVEIDDTKYIVLKYIYEMEDRANKYLGEFVDTEESIETEEESISEGSLRHKKYLMHKYITENSERLITNYEKDQAEGFRFTSGQKSAIEHCMLNKFSVVLGLPGTGKTEIVKCIMKIFSDHYKESDKECIISLTAPTGAAIKNLVNRCKYLLNDSSKKLSGTMHKLCYGVYKLIKDASSDKYKGLYPDIIIVDEISMADMDIFYQLLLHIKSFTKRYDQPKIILLGDDNQLSSVGYGNVLGNIIKSDLFPGPRLTEIMRNSGGIAKAITKMNEKKLKLALNDFNKDDFQFLNLKDYEDLDKELFKASRNMITLLDKIDFNLQRDRIIVAQNSTKDELLNPWLQNQYLLKNLNDKEKTKHQIYQYAYTKKNVIHINYYDNDRIIRTKNITTPQGIYLTNGDTGNIFKLTKENFEMCVQKSRELRKAISNEIMEITTANETIYTVPDNKIFIASDMVDKEGNNKNIVLNFAEVKASKIYIGIILYDTGEFELVRDIDIREEIDLAYCTTVHKAQGAEFDNVIVWTKCWMWSTNDIREKLKLFYTAVSRAKKKCIVIGKSSNISRFQENKKIPRLSWFLSKSWIKDNFAFLTAD